MLFYSRIFERFFTTSIAQGDVMTTTYRFFSALLAIGFGLFSGLCQAESKTAEQLQDELVSTWLVSVDGVPKPRILKINAITLKSGDVYTADSMFGLSEGNLASVKAEVSQAPQELKLTLTTQTEVQIAAVQQPNGTFVGTFTPKGATAKKVTLEKVSNGELSVKTAIITRPTADVPSSCAALVGQWSCNWSQGGIGQQWLWVVSMNNQCAAKVASGSAKAPFLQNASTVEIKDGALSYMCNKGTGGTCVYTKHGDALWASYSNPAGGINRAVCEKVQ